MDLRTGLLVRLVVLSFLSVEVALDASRHSYFVINKGQDLAGRKIKSLASDDLVSCALTCRRHELCQSASYNHETRTCTLYKDNTHSSPWTPERDPKYDLIEMIGDTDAGLSRITAVRSCKELASLRPKSVSGVYWIKPDSNSDAFQAYCDQTTEGGGWTLVWSYTFTNYKDFSSQSNAVTPSPRWPPVGSCSGGSSVSTDAPLNETQYDAIDFRLWKTIGRQFLIKSNINNWFVCDPQKGSLTEWSSGDVSCRKVKDVAGHVCTNAPAAPGFFIANSCFPELRHKAGQGIFFNFIGNLTALGWPVNDPCGESKPRFVKNVQNPHGNILIR